MTWGMLSTCTVTTHLCKEFLETVFPDRPFETFSSLELAQQAHHVQAWILDECVILGLLRPFLGLTSLANNPFNRPAMKFSKGWCLEKPFKLPVFLNQLEQIQAVIPFLAVIGPYLFNLQARSLEDSLGTTIRLREKEADILTYLLQAPQHQCRKEDLLAHVWGYHEHIQTHTLETHIYQLRQKLESDPSAPNYLVNQKGGYGLNHAFLLNTLSNH